MVASRDSAFYWDEQRRKARGFEEAAEAAKRELFPELSFSDYEPSITVCRVCGGEGFHREECKLKHPDGKDKPEISDIMKYADTDQPARKSLVEYEKERLEKLGVSPKEKAKVAAVEAEQPVKP